VELVPLAFETVSVTVYVPAVFHTIPVGFCAVEVAGVALGNVQLQDVGLKEEASVKLLDAPTHVIMLVGVNWAIGGSVPGL
jgi:hypothetical protein